MITVEEEYPLKLNPISTFKVAIYDMKVFDVINRDAFMVGDKVIMGSEAGDPYAIINFDEVHIARTKYVSGRATTEFAETYYMNKETSAKFDTDDLVDDDENKDWHFTYSTKYPKKLDRKYLTITANDHDTIGHDDLIGEARVDLMTLAAGPVQQNLTLWDGDIEAGRVEFKVKMKQITRPVLRFDEFLYTEAKGKYFIKIRFGNQFVKVLNRKDKGFASKVLAITNPSEPAVLNVELGNVSFDTLHDPKKGGRIEILVFNSKPKTDTDKPSAKAVFETRKIMYCDAVTARSNFLLGEGTPFSFMLRAYELPFYSQMKEGVNLGYEVLGGQIFPDDIPRLPIPHASKKEVVEINITEDDMNPLGNEPKINK